jgi:predicted nucleic acid-binding protein
MASIIIQDACVLINLVASGRFREIATGCDLQFAVSSVVSQEALFLHNLDSGEREKIDLQPSIEQGIIKIFSVQSESERLRYIELAVSLDDGEAEAIAIAEGRQFALATDDRKARNVILRGGFKIELWSTCKLLQHWQKECAVQNDVLSNVLVSISQRARYRPKPGHPDSDWWMNLLKK